MDGGGDRRRGTRLRGGHQEFCDKFEMCGSQMHTFWYYWHIDEIESCGNGRDALEGRCSLPLRGQVEGKRQVVGGM